MPRTIARSTPPLDSLTAAAYEVPKGDRQGVQRMAWQDEAWAFYDTTGELRYASAWFANAVSRATLIASKPDEDDVLRPVEDQRVKTIVNNLFGGPVRQEAGTGPGQPSGRRCAGSLPEPVSHPPCR